MKQVNTDVVIIAGGPAGLTLAEDFFPFMIPGITGDGLRPCG